MSRISGFMKKAMVPLAFTSMLGANSAQATVDALMTYTVPFESFHSEDYCLADQLMWAVIGIPSGSILEATFAPAYIYGQRLGGDPVEEDINVLSNSGIKTRLVDELWNDGIAAPIVEIDVSALSLKNGTSKAGRQKTINLTKLAVIALNAGLTKNYSSYKMDLKIDGLPSQDNLQGQFVYAQTSYPYTSGSTLVEKYRNELINANGGCPNLGR